MRRFYLLSGSIIVLLLLFGVAFFAFSQDRPMNDNRNQMPRVTNDMPPRGNIQQIQQNLENQTKVTVEGKLVYENRRLPEVTNAKETIKVMMPPVVVEILEINDGDAVKIEGYKREQYFRSPFSKIKKESVIVVTKVTYKGKDFDIEKELAGYGFASPRGRMMGDFDRGRGFCPFFD